MSELPIGTIRIKPWEEAVGDLLKIAAFQGFIIAEIGHINLLLPNDLESLLTPLIGKRIGIIRTDDLRRPYRWRVIN
ncbi:MAG: hypothetical protein GYA29_00750 [Methanothrix sp.]|nr:hypothetical protein [Methanothrix sp.]